MSNWLFLKKSHDGADEVEYCWREQDTKLETQGCNFEIHFVANYKLFFI